MTAAAAFPFKMLPSLRLREGMRPFCDMCLRGFLGSWYRAMSSSSSSSSSFKMWMWLWLWLWP